MGCEYQNKAKEWMTRNIFLSWLKYFDRRMANRSVLLILDNCSAPIPGDELPSRISH